MEMKLSALEYGNQKKEDDNSKCKIAERVAK